MKKFVGNFEIQIAIEQHSHTKRVHVLDTQNNTVEYFEVLRGETDQEAINRVADELIVESD